MRFEEFNLCKMFVKTSICHFLTNRKSPFFPLANKRARQVKNLVASRLKFLAFFSCFDLILSSPPFCYCKKRIDVSFSCVCPVIDSEFRHNIVEVVCGSTATLTML